MVNKRISELEKKEDTKICLRRKFKIMMINKGIEFSKFIDALLYHYFMNNSDLKADLLALEVEYQRKEIEKLENNFKNEIGISLEEHVNKKGKISIIDDSQNYEKLHDYLMKDGRKLDDPKLSAWLETRARDFGIFESPYEIIRKLKEKSEGDDNGGAS